MCVCLCVCFSLSLSRPISSPPFSFSRTVLFVVFRELLLLGFLKEYKAADERLFSPQRIHALQGIHSRPEVSSSQRIYHPAKNIHRPPKNICLPKEYLSPQRIFVPPKNICPPRNSSSPKKSLPVACFVVGRPFSCLRSRSAEAPEPEE